MKTKLLKMLAMLASEAFQERFIVEGTKEAYALPEEILDSAISSARAAIESSVVSQEFSPADAGVIRDFIAEASSSLQRINFQDESVTNEELITRNQFWKMARSEAGRLLNALNFSLDAWEREQGLR